MQAQAHQSAEEFRGARQVHDRERILTWRESGERARALSIVVTKGKRRGAHLDTVLDNGVREVELVALRRVAPRSAAQRTREKLQPPTPDRPLNAGELSQRDNYNWYQRAASVPLAPDGQVP
jgi:hypothetical protein